MSRFVGGEGMPVFLSRIQADATSSLSEEELKRIEPLLARKAGFVEIPAAARNRTFVRKWTAADVVDLLIETDERPDFDRGRKLFVAAACSACHRLGGTGTVIGPDLTSVGRRFSRRDILQSILEPSRVVAEQYRLDVIMTKAGKVLSGTILPGNDYRSPELHILPDPLNPGEIVKIAKQDVEEHLKSEASLMPSGLLDTLTKQEILALLTYLETGGNPQHPRYRR